MMWAAACDRHAIVARLVAARADLHLPDRYPGVGPAGGILAALEQSPGDVFVLAGDLRSDRKGEIARTRLKLPAELKGSPTLQVCLKDLATDSMSCFTLLPQSQ